MPGSPAAPVHRAGRWVVVLAVASVCLNLVACGNRRPESEALGQEGQGAAVGGPGGSAGTDVIGSGGASSGAGGVDALPGTGGTGPAASGASGVSDVPDADVGGRAATDRPVAPSGAAAASGPATYDSGATERTVKVASISSLTGLFSDFFQPRAARAHLKAVNAAGGVNGRTIEFVIYDDQWDVTRNAALTRQAIDTDDVFAFVDNQAIITGQGGKAYIEQKRFPVVGGDTGNLSTWGVSPYYYPQAMLGAVNGGRLMARWAREVRCKAIAGFTMAVDESRGFLKSFRNGLEELGLPDFVHYGEISMAETDYTQYAAQAKAARADCVVIGGQTNFYVRFLRAASQQSYDPVLLVPAGYDPAYIEADVPNEGDYFLQQSDIVENAGVNPAIARMVQEIRRYEPGMKINGWAINGYAAAQLFVEALRRAGDQLTRANLIEVLDSIKDFRTGIVPPMSFAPGPKAGSNCAFVGQVRAKKATLVRSDYCL